MLPAGDERYEGREVSPTFAREAWHVFDRCSGKRIEVSAAAPVAGRVSEYA